MIWLLIAYVLGSALVALGVFSDENVEPGFAAVLIFGWPIVIPLFVVAIFADIALTELLWAKK